MRCAFVLLLVFGGCVYQIGALPPTTVRLGHITPFSGAWSGGLQMEAAVILALEDVNAATSILPTTALKRVVKDSACDPGLGVKSFIGTLLRLLWSGVTGLCLDDRDRPWTSYCACRIYNKLTNQACSTGV